MQNGAFLKHLVELRKEKGYSQKKAADLLRVSPAMLSHYEHGIREPGIDFLLQVAQTYDCSLDYLLGRTNDRRGIPWIPEENAFEDRDVFDDELSIRTQRLCRAIDALSMLYENAGLQEALHLYMKTALYRFARTTVTGSSIDFSLRKSEAQNLALALESRLLADSDGAWSIEAVKDPDVSGAEALKAILEETEMRIKEDRIR